MRRINTLLSVTLLPVWFLFPFRHMAEAKVSTKEGTLMEEGSYKIKDIEGNSYTVVLIGDQEWITENLKVTRYNDGTIITNVTDDSTWSKLSTGAYCWYRNDEAAVKNTYGAIYNWYSVSKGNLCPAGWHVPTDAEWTTLITSLGGGIAADGILKETGTTHWKGTNAGATNEFGFSALPGGYRCDCGVFDLIGYSGTWWSSTEYDSYNVCTISMYSNYNFVSRSYNYKRSGFSVRCIAD